MIRDGAKYSFGGNAFVRPYIENAHNHDNTAPWLWPTVEDIELVSKIARGDITHVAYSEGLFVSAIGRWRDHSPTDD